MTTRKKAKGKPGQARNPWRDHYAEKARKEGYPARSVYKLQEIQRRWKILAPGKKVLDLGCSPGSWLLFASQTVGPSGKITGVDLKPVDTSAMPWVRMITGDVTSPELAEELGGSFDVLLSDMAPNTCGNRDLDALRSAMLAEAALDLAGRVLVPGGAFVCKIFQGDGFEEFMARVRPRFGKTRLFKPQSTRTASREIYIIATEAKPAPEGGWEPATV
ncbi:MAG: RlmE family RNA methyltransferase [Proteobacteria bacterium]|nr:RlmE family RNA methyltransferase [Pseudomonadota bacterium]